MFQLKQVACAYEQKKVFTGLDLEIRQGQYVMLMGENGTGKSSLISLLTGFKQEESGRILFLGKDLKEWLKDKRQKRDFYSRLGILFQDVDSQLFNCTVYDEIAFGPRQLGLTEEVSQRVQDTLSLLKIEDLRDRVPYQLSGGEKKKVAFASIMVTNPDVYILDEPFNNLSMKNFLGNFYMSFIQLGKPLSCLLITLSIFITKRLMFFFLKTAKLISFLPRKCSVTSK